MQGITIIQLSPEQLKKVIVEAMTEQSFKQQEQDNLTGTVSINRAAKLIGCSHSTVKKLIYEKQIKTTVDQRRIPLREVNNYLGTQ